MFAVVGGDDGAAVVDLRAHDQQRAFEQFDDLGGQVAEVDVGAADPKPPVAGGAIQHRLRGLAKEPAMQFEQFLARLGRDHREVNARFPAAGRTGTCRLIVLSTRPGRWRCPGGARPRRRARFPRRLESRWFPLRIHRSAALRRRRTWPSGIACRGSGRSISVRDRNRRCRPLSSRTC